MKFTRVRRRRMTKVQLRRESPLDIEKTRDYSAFLFADVWVEPSGMSLSVNSALARLNLDPWREASRLASMERTPAALTLSRAIARSSNQPASADVAAIAARLIKLLPDRAAARGTRDRRADDGHARHFWVPRLTAWRLCLILGFVYLVAYAWLHS
jgi:hypothetical protein